MYIKSVTIENIRAIRNFNMNFENPAGWHVLIGDNGTGKSTIIKSIALALIGEKEALGLRADWNEWLNKESGSGLISLDLDYVNILKQHVEFSLVRSGTTISINSKSVDDVNGNLNRNMPAGNANENLNLNIPAADNEGFSVAYGPFRRFTGGNPEWQKVFTSYPKLGAHLSVFGEDVALTEAINWLVTLKYQKLEQKNEGLIIDDVMRLINSPDFLPHNTSIVDISSDGVTFQDGNGSQISVNQLSDGYRSILSLTFELIRQLVRVYGADLVFKNIRNNKMEIDLPGVVLIDEIDAHLHPTWQTRIGQWFQKYFPKLQFIVTTHSPLICRACESGTIWHLAAPGSEQSSGEITGTERDRLIYGNILDAYGTQAFGEQVSISQSSNDKLKRLAELNVKSMMGKISEDENHEMVALKTILPTEKK